MGDDVSHLRVTQCASRVGTDRRCAIVQLAGVVIIFLIFLNGKYSMMTTYLEYIREDLP